MSLLATASPWNTTDDSGIPKKRTPMLNIRKTAKRPVESPTDEHEPSSVLGSSTPMSLDELQSYNSDKQSRVHQLIDTITKVNSQTADNKMGDFIPLSANTKNDLLPLSFDNALERRSGVLANPPKQAPSNLYLANETNLGKYSNYRMAHDPNLLKSATMPETSRYYSRPDRNMVSDDRRIMDKINYMIHLLEEQQMEKTNNVMEEFILYSMLGVFVIFIVDSFSRSGKYMR